MGRQGAPRNDSNGENNVIQTALAIKLVAHHIWGSHSYTSHIFLALSSDLVCSPQYHPCIKSKSGKSALLFQGLSSSSAPQPSEPLLVIPQPHYPQRMILASLHLCYTT